MTDQISDELFFENQVYFIRGVKGDNYITPETFGMKPFSRGSSCWRGYLMKYKILENKLILDKMLVNVEIAPEINNIKPRINGNRFKFAYENLVFPTHFTGELLAFKDVMKAINGSKTLLIFHIQDGGIIQEEDISNNIAKKMKFSRL